jgi:hypothetical protein
MEARPIPRIRQTSWLCPRVDKEVSSARFAVRNCDISPCQGTPIDILVPYTSHGDQE